MSGRYLLPAALLCVLACAADVSTEAVRGGRRVSDGPQEPETTPQLDASTAAPDTRGEDARADVGAALAPNAPPRPDASTGDAHLDAGDASSTGDASSATADGSAPCNALRPSMFSASLVVSADQPLAFPTGGVIHNGTYRLEEATVYDPDPNRAQGVREMRVETLKIEGDVWQHVAYWNGEPTTRFTHRASLRENFVSLGLSCGSEFDARVFSGLRNSSNGTYTALPQMLTLQLIGDGEAGHVYVLKYLRIE